MKQPGCNKKVQSFQAHSSHPMPIIHPLFTSNDPLALALAVQAGSVELDLWVKNQERFPERDIAALPPHRQLEHFAVDVVLQRLGWEAAQLRVVHGANGQPQIQSDDSSVSKWALSISHHSKGGLCHVLVAIGSKPLGCDIECERKSIQQIAHRVFGPDEGTAESTLGRLSALWTVKESMFKAFGPGLDFRKHLHVSLPTQWDSEDPSTWTIEGHVHERAYHWHVSSRKSPVNNELFWICFGPQEIQAL